MDLVDRRENRNVAPWKAEVPLAARHLTREQRKFLGAVAELLRQREAWDQVDLHHAIEAEREKMALGRRDAVYALMLTFFGKPAGQQPAWYLAHASRPFALERLDAVASSTAPAPG